MLISEIRDSPISVFGYASIRDIFGEKKKKEFQIDKHLFCHDDSAPAGFHCLQMNTIPG